MTEDIFICCSFLGQKIFVSGHQIQNVLRKKISIPPHPHHQGCQVPPWHITLPVLNLLI